MDAHYANARVVTLRGSSWSAQVCMVEHPARPEVARPLKLLLIHGNPSYIGDWAHTIPALRTIGDVVAFDQVGFGRSPGLVGAEPTVSTCAELAVALADALGWETFIPVGQSHGGLVACAIAARYPRRTQALIMLGAAGTPAHLGYRLLALPLVRRALNDLVAPILRWRSAEAVVNRLAELTVRNVYGPDSAPPGVAAQHLARFAADPAALEVIAAVAQGDPCRAAGRHAAQIEAPVLFVHGEDDRLVPIAYARRLYAATCAASARPTFVEVPGGHMVHYCRAELVNEIILDWLQPLSEPRALPDRP